MFVKDKVTSQPTVGDPTKPGVSVPAGVNKVTTYAYDASLHATRGGAVYRASSLAETTGVDSRFWFLSANGRYFIIDENQKITLTMAGGLGDLKYGLESGLAPGGGNGDGTLANRSTDGFIRTVGTNDRDAMLALDAFCFARGIWAYVDADHYISGETSLQSRWVGVEEFKYTLWVRYLYTGGVFDKIECGFVFNTSDSGLIGLKIVGQWDTSFLKPGITRPDMPILGPGGGLGHLGAIIRVGEFNVPSTDASPATLPRLTNIDMRIMLMRAGHKAAAGNRSAGNIMIAYMGYVEHSNVEVGLFGRTNTSSNYVTLFHFGFSYDPTLDGFDPTDAPQKTQATYLETWHPSYIRLKFLTKIDNEATGARVIRPWQSAGTGPMIVESYEANGVAQGAGDIGATDYADMLTTEAQKGIVGRGIRIGFIKATKCWQLNFSTESNNGGFHIKGEGTVAGSGHLYDGTAANIPDIDVTTLVAVAPQKQWTGNRGIPLRPQQEYDVICDGFDLEVLNSPGDPMPNEDSVFGMYIHNCLGRIDLGSVTIRGANRRGIEIQHSNAEIVVRKYEGVGVLSYEFSRGGKFYRINNSRTEGELPFTSGGSTPIIVGDLITGVTSGATALVDEVVLRSGTWAGGDATGHFNVRDITGSFVVENIFRPGGTNDASTTGIATGTGVYKPGFDTENVCVRAVGTSFTAGTLAANVAVGATKIPLGAYLPTSVFIGDRIQVGSTWTVATQQIPSPVTVNVAHAGGSTPVNFGGVKYLTVAPMTAAVTIGQTVTVDQRAVINELQAGFESSQYGLTVSRADVLNCDLSEVKYTGQYCARVINDGYLDLVGELPATAGRIDRSDSYTVKVEETGRVTARGLRIPDNARVAQHFQLFPGRPKLTLTGCEVEDLTNLVTALDRKEQVQVLGLTDYGNVQRAIRGATAAAGSTIAYETSHNDAYKTILSVDTTLESLPAGNRAIGKLLCTFPDNVIVLESARMELAITQSPGGGIAADTPDGGLGTTVASGAVAVLGGTPAFENIITGQTFNNCNGTIEDATIINQPLVMRNGTSHNVYFNVADSWSGVDPGARLTGTVTLIWRNMGDYPLP